LRRQQRIAWMMPIAEGCAEQYLRIRKIAEISPRSPRTAAEDRLSAASRRHLGGISAASRRYLGGISAVSAQALLTLEAALDDSSLSEAWGTGTRHRHSHPHPTSLASTSHVTRSHIPTRRSLSAHVGSRVYLRAGVRARWLQHVVSAATPSALKHLLAVLVRHVAWESLDVER